jgi:hypothetical protein
VYRSLTKTPINIGVTKFFKVLQPETDTRYFAYLASKQQDLISVYHDKNKKHVDVYVNYHQTKGNGLLGIATSFNGV